MDNNARGMERLLTLGGFFEKAISDQMFELYPKEVLVAVGNWTQFGKGFLDAADAVLLEYMKLDAVSSDMCRGDANKSYVEWYLNQTAYLLVRESPQERHFWSDWYMHPVLKNQLGKLSPVEEKMLGLYSGAIDEKPYSIERLAELDVFACEEKFIIRTLHRIFDEINLDWFNDALFMRGLDSIIKHDVPEIKEEM